MKNKMVYLLALVLFLLPSYLIRFRILGIPTNLLDVFIISAMLVGFVLIFRKNNFRNLLPKPYTLIPISLFLAAGAISVFASPDKLSALGYLKSWIILPILFGFLIKIFVKEEKDWKVLLGGLITGATLISIHAIYQKISGQVSTDGRVLGIYGLFPAEHASANYLSLYLTLIAAITLALTVQQVIKSIGRQADKPIGRELLFLSSYLLILLSIVFAIYFSGSRGGFLGIVAALLLTAYYLLLSRFPQFKKQLKTGVILLVFLGFVTVYFWARPDLSAPPTAGRVSTSNNIRYEIWKTSGQIILKNPILGVGLGNFQNYFTDFTKDRINYPEFISPQAYSPHNIFLALWLNLGILGLISFVWILFLFFKKIIQSSIFSTTYYFNSPFLIPLIAIIAFLVHGLVDTPYFKNDLAIIFWFLFSFVL